MRFGSEGELVGHGGCNRYFSTYKLSENTIEIGPIAATRMACPDPAMEHERLFLQALQNARQIARNGTDLWLNDAAGNPLVQLTHSDPDE